MKQYESKFKYFKFIGPSPIDFDKKKHFGNCVWNGDVITKLFKFEVLVLLKIMLLSSSSQLEELLFF